MAFFLLSKIFWVLLSPSNLFVVFTLVLAFLAARRCRRGGRALIISGVVALLLACYAPVGTLLLRPLEDRFPRADLADAHPAGIIVLGGPVDPIIGAARGGVHLREGADRMTAAVALSRQYPDIPLVFTGGITNLLVQERSEAADARQLWIDMGVPAERIVIEDRARNTAENAENVRIRLQPKAGSRYILVTSAFHMPRSVGLLRKAGIDVLPDPVDYRTTGRAIDLLPQLFANEGLGTFDLAVHEWLGLAAYYLSGKIASPFPGPVDISPSSGSVSSARRASETN